MIEINGNQRAHIILMEHDALPIRYFWTCCSITVFNSSNWEQYFSKFIVSLFIKSS